MGSKSSPEFQKSSLERTTTDVIKECMTLGHDAPSWAHEFFSEVRAICSMLMSSSGTLDQLGDMDSLLHDSGRPLDGIRQPRCSKQTSPIFVKGDLSSRRDA